MVAAWLTNEEETTLKRYYHEGDRVRLQPENSQMEPIYVAPDNLQIQGKVLAVIRQVN
jgi:repressor LexA